MSWQEMKIVSTCLVCEAVKEKGRNEGELVCKSTWEWGRCGFDVMLINDKGSVIECVVAASNIGQAA